MKNKSYTEGHEENEKQAIYSSDMIKIFIF